MPIKNAPSIQMICDHLGLSKATVSKALNGYPEVKGQTREAVARYAQEIGYRQDKPAPLFSSASVRRIGMPGRVPGSERTDFSGDYQVMAGFRDEAQRHGMQIILLPSIKTEVQAETTLEALMAPYQLDGILISGLRIDDPYFEQLQRIQIPTVLWDLKMARGNDKIGTVCYDSLRGAQMAVEHLISLGHKRIALLNGHRFAQVSYDRLDGYHLALASTGILPDPALEMWGDFTENGAEEAAERFLSAGATAVFCACDATAIGLIRQLELKGKKVPRDISVVGYDDSPLSAAVYPTLTTISQDFYHIGQVACGMMSALLQELPLHHESVLPVLVQRDSTGPVPSK